MKILFITLAFIFAAIISSAAHAEFITFTNEPLTREERMIKIQLLKHRNSAFSIHDEPTYIQSSNKIYIFRDVQSESDRVFELAVEKLDRKGERYVGR